LKKDRANSESARQGRAAGDSILLSVLWVLSLASFLTSTAVAGPQYDPFLEQFQVGTFRSPEDVAMAGGFPAGLIEPSRVDRFWTGGALQVLAESQCTLDSEYFVPRFLAATRSPAQGREWLAERRQLVQVFASGESAPPAEIAGKPPFLLAERLAQQVFASLRRGDPASAAAGARHLAASESTLGLPARTRHVWSMRAELLGRMSGSITDPLQTPWSTLLDLGPYDAGSAWALWVATCRQSERSPFDGAESGKDRARFLGGLRQAWVNRADLEKSGFSTEFKGGLGGSILPKEELAAHFKRYAKPPGDFTAQGWWVAGQRRLQRGVAPFYEQLAARKDLSPGWRMDVWRRVSEVHLLGGRWPQGLAALDRALDHAQKKNGTLSLRRRLRQWTEQAAVLAVSQGDSIRAGLILDKGENAFSGEELEAYRSETRYWRGILADDLEPPDADRRAQAYRLVEAGRSPALYANSSKRRAALNRLADQVDWRLWARWGLALADTNILSGDIRRRAGDYERLLAVVQATAEPGAQESAAMQAVARRLAGSGELDTLLECALDGDIGRACRWQTPPQRSPVPRVVNRLRRSQLDLHALLGFAMGMGDMRGTLAVATVLPGSGLTGDERKRFLYPLPGQGPILEALLAAETDPALILAVARNESLFEPAVRSRAGALGWMQIMPFHFTERGAGQGAVNWRTPANSIGLGDRLLAENRRRYTEDPYLTVAAYNAGPGAVKRWLKQLDEHPSRDVYLAWIGYPETRRYLEKVLIDREIYDWILSGN